MIKRNLLVLFVAILILMGCTRNKNGNNDVVQPAQTEPLEEQVKTTLTLNNSPSSDSAESSNENKDSGEFESLPLGGREKLVYRTLTTSLYPEDMKIGLLGPPESDMVFLVTSFFNDVMKDKSSLSAHILPGLEEYMGIILRDFPQEEMDLRVGDVTYFDEGQASVLCRFFRNFGDGRKSDVTGEVFLQIDNGIWYIMAADLDWGQLEEVNPPGITAFEPEVYRWLGLF